jgi:hypothetical protein
MTLRERIDRWFLELWVRRNGAILDEVVHPECTIHGIPGVKHGPAGLRPFYELFGRAFSRIEARVEDSVESGDKIGFRCTMTVLARDGTVHEFTGGGLARFQGDQIIEAWNCFDHLALMTSMGNVPHDTFVEALIAQVRLAAGS